MDGKILNEVILPIMNVSRRCLDGSVHPEETLNKSQIYVTTAGYKNSYSYDKLITLLVRMVLEPEKAIVLGGSYRIKGVLSKLYEFYQKCGLRNLLTVNELNFNTVPSLIEGVTTIQDGVGLLLINKSKRITLTKGQ